jgi:NADPH-dependent curcumin reductase CurA
LPESNTRVVLRSRPRGRPEPENFAVEVGPVPVAGPGEVLLRTVYLSLDPYMRGRISDSPMFPVRVGIGEVVLGGTVSQVVASHDARLSSGDLVLAQSGWQAYGVQAAAEVTRLAPARAPVSTALGVLGVPGFTGYAGLLEIGRPAAGETVVVAAATGPVGSLVGQVARIKGARAVGIAGGARKVAHLLELGFDAAIDHRSESFREELADAVPDGIDVYFENVGGHVWDAVFPHLNRFARVPVSGLVAHYNDTGPPAGPDRTAALMRTAQLKSWTIRGFIQSEFAEARYGAFQDDVSGWIRSGELSYRETVVDGLERAPEAFIGLLDGRHLGKLLVRCAPDPHPAHAG